MVAPQASVLQPALAAEPSAPLPAPVLYLGTPDSECETLTQP